MKNIINKNIAILFVALGLSLLASCDLKLQEPFEYEPEVPTLTTFKDKTVWEWLQTQKTFGSDTATIFGAKKFDLLIQAITITGLQAEFTKAGDQRTFFLLNNTAFTGTGAGKVLVAITGSATGKLATIDSTRKVRLTNLLKYHIVDAYVDQVKALPVYNEDYTFNTLGSEPNSKMSIRRGTRYEIGINNSALLPTTKRQVSVSSHNYIFGNGIGHILETYTQLVNF